MNCIQTSKFEKLVTNAFLFVLLVLNLASCNKKETAIDVVYADSKQAIFQVEGKSATNSWSISPEFSPDIYPVEIEYGGSATVHFYTDRDSITYVIEAGEKQDFLVVLNQNDTANTRIQAVVPSATFSEKYIKENRGKWTVEIVEVQELLQVVLAITKTGLEDTKSLIVNHDTTNYYLKVLDKFLPYKNEPIVGIMDSLLNKGLYINLKADACAFIFDNNNNIIKHSAYDRMNGAFNLIDPYISKLNDFALKSDFREFYFLNANFYDSLIQWHINDFSTKKQWEWLEKQFPDHHYDNYRITFSPLVKGNHSTVRFNKNGFKQAVMFIRPPYVVKNVSEEVSKGLVTRIVFTEIDHNYVNPETDKYIKEVNEYFKDREKWTGGKESKGYNSPYTVFNEYMTWSVYLLYCYDNFNDADFEVINDRIVNYIINRRGFIRFDEFNGTLLKLYSERPEGTTIADLYPSLLEWSKNYEPE